VLPPPALEDGADLPGAPAAAATAPPAPAAAPTPAAPAPAAATPSQKQAGETKAPAAETRVEPTEEKAPQPAAEQKAATAKREAKVEDSTAAATPAETIAYQETPGTNVAVPHEEPRPVALEKTEDPEKVYEQVLKEQLDAGSSPQVAEARAKVARVKAERGIKRGPTPIQTDKMVPSAPTKGAPPEPKPSGAPEAKEPRPSQGPVAPTPVETQKADDKKRSDG
jgi:hypothetical protein